MTFTLFIDYLIRLVDFSVFCAAQPMPYIGCGQFWGWFYLIAILVLFFFCCFLVSKILRERREWRDYLQRKADREKIADTETMAKHIWTGDF